VTVVERNDEDLCAHNCDQEDADTELQSVRGHRNRHDAARKKSPGQGVEGLDRKKPA
jgi:hypothetical protein